jgi:hypothetical protein
VVMLVPPLSRERKLNRLERNETPFSGSVDAKSRFRLIRNLLGFPVIRKHSS